MSKKPSNYDQIQQLVNKANGIKEEPKQDNSNVKLGDVEIDLDPTYFDYHETAYMPVFNKERNAYDMYLIRINTETQQAVVEVEPRNYNTKVRAHFEVVSLLNEEFVKGGKK